MINVKALLYFIHIIYRESFAIEFKYLLLIMNSFFAIISNFFIKSFEILNCANS